MRPLTFLLAIWTAAGLSACETGLPCPGDCSAAVIATGADADVLFPPLVQSGVGFGVVQQVFLKLADIGLAMNTVGDSGFVRKLASSWEFEDQSTIVFQLDPRARWHDGTPVTAADVEFTFDVYTDTLVNAPARPLLGSVAAVVARDERTVAFEFNREYAEQFYDATHHMWIIPRHLLDTVPRGRLASHPYGQDPVGSGPYRLHAWRRGEMLELRADSLFFLGVPGIARLIWRISPDFNTSLTQLTAGQADIMPVIVGRENIERVQASEHLRLVDYPSAVYYYLGFNLRAPGAPERPHRLFDDRELRRAIALGIDREAIIGAVFGEWAQIAGGPTPPAVWIWDADRRQLPFDSARARRMLADLGWRDGDGDGTVERDGKPLAFEILYPSSSSAREQAAVILQEQLRHLGATVELEPVEFNTFVARLADGQFDAAIGAWSVDPPPVAMWQYWSREGIGGSNHGRYASALFDSLVSRAAAIEDQAEARAAWDEAIQVINEDAPAVWLLTPSFLAGVHRRFRNVTLRPDLWAATLWTWTVE
ncbi:MAG: hypothetical protein IH965_14225 [Gemmatimonadetes bacterium]|nr:hypothetical protein [Gemmatimonadota bacterium]